jgi:predicted nucleic acid-binding protein
MTFADMPAGAAIFVDAIVFVYHFVPHPVWRKASQDLLSRIAKQELAGYTSADAISDVLHKSMTAEAVQTLGYSPGKITSRLRHRPQDVMCLRNYAQVVADVVAFGIKGLPITLPLLHDTVRLCQQHGLLTNDALVVAVMQQHGLTDLASNDPDFDRVPGITRYEPA